MSKKQLIHDIQSEIRLLDEIREKNLKFDDLLVKYNTLESEVRRLGIRDRLFKQFMDQIKIYYGGDGGFATLQDGHYIEVQLIIKCFSFIEKHGVTPKAMPLLQELKQYFENNEYARNRLVSNAKR